MLTIKRQEDGFASNFIFDNWQVGTVIEASAPLGEFVYEPLRDAPNIVGLAGGSGVTPLCPGPGHCRWDGRGPPPCFMEAGEPMKFC